MKLGLIILMTVALMINALSFVFIYASFKIHQDYIAANLCVKKEEPVNTCQGHCQLKKKMVEQESQEKESPLIREGSISFTYFSPVFHFFFRTLLSSVNHPKIFILSSLPSPDMEDIFHPPKIFRKTSQA